MNNTMTTEKESTTGCLADRELCETKTQTFYNMVGDNMVYVTVTVQKLPKEVHTGKNKNRYKTVREFLEFTAETMDYLDIGQLFSSQS